MVVGTATQLLSFEDYLSYFDDTDSRYELVDGILVAMTPPTIKHMLIAEFIQNRLKQEIERFNFPWLCLREAGVRTGVRKSRLMDVCVVTTEQAEVLMNKSAVFETPPLLAVEVVSAESINRDYRHKRSEYAVAEIPEYWVVDPLENKVSVLPLEEGFYETADFTGKQQIVSSLFRELKMTVDQIFGVNP